MVEKNPEMADAAESQKPRRALLSPNLPEVDNFLKLNPFSFSSLSAVDDDLNVKLAIFSNYN